MDIVSEKPDHGQAAFKAGPAVLETSGKILTENTRLATETEHNLTFWQAVKIYRKAVAWSIIVSMATIMESYDIQIIGSFYAYPTFQKKYGERLPNGKYSIPAKWQVALTLSASVGIIIGIFANGILVDRFGHKKLLLISYVLMTAFIFITFFAPSIEVLLAGEFLCGLPWGVFGILAPSYAAEVCPTALRGYLTTYVNLCWVIGHIIAAGSYRIPFAVQWIWPVPLFFILCFAPDSPWWLVRQNRHEDAEHALLRLSEFKDEGNTSVKQNLDMMIYTNQHELDTNVGGSYLDCFKGPDLRRTEIACLAWTTQVFSGFAIQAYITYFFTLAGLSPGDSYKLALGTYSIAFVGTASSWVLQAYVGRRKIFLFGLAAMTPIMWIVGFLALAPPTGAIAWAQSVLLLVWFGAYGLTIGPIPFVIASEIGATRLRSKTLSLARNSCYLMVIVNVVVAPYMLNLAQGNLKGIAAFPAAGLSMLCLLWAYFRLPETKGRTYTELDILFELGLPARKFKGYVIDALDVVEKVD
ncbi:Uncharacterized protein BP5553_08298 [Venustampulla echinocandica]|uniref:Major facilitator superfamily (MFS) profile domain-containing protein n=1 Tax=Venustampulla echinocandica TaxID=2656787 RepID=A0A370TGB2_9HELO|nr:Uncharacterized protein BP5553_08298 [Venustampulla echinocandica]RDL33930.1 Uncharacterized protein BP5553_08298 [Venustampulla echinocandica]